MATIMVVDDEKDVVTLIKFILEKDGHKILEALNGAQALELMGVEPPGLLQVPDLIVLDVMMPVMDGYTMATKLREHAETRSVPLLILTAKGQMREVFEMSPNVAAYIEKPFDPKHLKELIAGMLARRTRPSGPAAGG